MEGKEGEGEVGGGWGGGRERGRGGGERRKKGRVERRVERKEGRRVEREEGGRKEGGGKGQSDRGREEVKACHFCIKVIVLIRTCVEEGIKKILLE